MVVLAIVVKLLYGWSGVSDVSLIALLGLPDFFYISIEFQLKRITYSTMCCISAIVYHNTISCLFII